MALYHFEIGFPKFYKAPKHAVIPRYGNHSRFEAQVDRYGKIELPKIIDLSQFMAIEIEIINGKVMKTLYRGTLDTTRDLCVVLTHDNFVKTCWVNLKTDLHRTLNRNKYDLPEAA